MTNPLKAAYTAATSPKASAAPIATPVPSPLTNASIADGSLVALRAKLAASTARVNPPEAKIADNALEPEPSAAVSMNANATPNLAVAAVSADSNPAAYDFPKQPSNIQVAATAMAAKRTRRTKAEMEAARAVANNPEAYPIGEPATPVTPGVGQSVVESAKPSLADYTTEALLAEVLRRVSRGN